MALPRYSPPDGPFLSVLPGGLNQPTTVTVEQRVWDEVVAEGLSLVADVVASVSRMQYAAAAGSRHAVVNEANRLGSLAIACRKEIERLTGPEDAA